MVIVERSDCLISKHWAGLVFMTSDPSGETVNKIHPHLVTGDEHHNNRLHHNTLRLTPILIASVMGFVMNFFHGNF